MSLPNQLTLMRIALTPVFVLLLFLDSLVSRLGSFGVFTMAALTDWYDGYAARKSGEFSMWGRFLDPLADKILVSSGFICFSVLGYVSAWMVLIIVIRDFFITGLRSYAVIKGRSIRTNFLAKTKTFSQFCVLYFIFIFHLLSDGNKPPYDSQILHTIYEMDLIEILMYMITILTLISGIVYIVENKSHLRQIAGDVYRIFVPSDI
ncbi:MAG: CDP-diacylglycerol--glycerol-3-phosphate 3-phosphatidyltransferase [bacterium]